MSRFMSCMSFLSYIDSIRQVVESVPENIIEAMIAYALLQELATNALMELLAMTGDEEFSMACVEDIMCFVTWIETKLEECIRDFKVGS